MELRQLEYFVAVAEERSFTKGAQRVQIAQSAVSTAIARLERRLGVVLFDRGGREITLTAAGAALLPEARAMLATAHRVAGAARDAGSVTGATITLGTLLSLEPFDLTAVLSRFNRAHPEISVALRSSRRGSVEHLEAVGDGALDLALVATLDPSGFAVRLLHLTDMPQKLLCGPGHRLATAEVVDVGDLAGESFVDFPVGWGARSLTDRAFDAAGVAREVRFEAAEASDVIGLVREGCCLGVMPPGFVTSYADITTLDVDGIDLSLPIALATPRDRELSPAAADLADDLRRTAAAARRQQTG